MRLDRNINSDRMGKYALINLRTNKVEWGDDDQFFVIKYKDKFAAKALAAYSEAVWDYVLGLREQIRVMRNNGPKRNKHWALELERLEVQASEYAEYAEEIKKEAGVAADTVNRKLPD